MRNTQMPTLGGTELRRRAVKSTAWFGVTRIGVQVSLWLVTIVLARLLTPGDYGLFAMALSILAFVEIFQELGLDAAIIQRQQVTREQLNGVFWFVVGASANSFGMVPQTLLTKEIHLHRRSMAEAAGVIVSIPVALGLAYGGYGVWALILGHVARAVALNITLAVLARWVPGLSVTFRGMRQILTFGLQIFGGRVIATLSTALNIAIVGRMLGGRAVGLYAMGRGLADGPHRISTSVINQISFPIFSRIQDDRATLVRYFLMISKYLAIISLPVQVGIALLAAELVPVVLSESWNEMVGILQIFALGGIAAVLPLPSAPLLQARGRPEVILRFGWISSTAVAVALLLGATFGLKGAAIAWLVAFVPARSILLLLGLRELGLSVQGYLRQLLSPLLATAAMAFSVLVVARLFTSEAEPLAQIAIEIGIGALTYVSALLVLDRRLTADIRTIAQDLFATAKAGT